MVLMIQTAGTKSSRRKGIRGADPPRNAVILNARHLKNPFGNTNGSKEKRHLDRVKEFLLRECHSKVMALVERGCQAIEQNKPVVITCLYGKDRSQAIAELIAARFHCSKVYFVHREGFNNRHY